jgi:hypothetical protein
VTKQLVPVDIPESWSDDTPVVANARRIIREETSIPYFSENVWSLAAIAPLRKRERLTCNFESLPSRFRLPVKKAVWLLINAGKPDRSVRRGGTRTKRWLAPATIAGFVDDIRAFLKYVAAETPEVRSLRGIVSETMDAFVGSLDGKLGRESVGSHYTSIRLLHDLTADFPARERLQEPSWVEDKVFLGDRGSDNSTPPVPDAVLTPMLLWAVAFVEEFADDILAARDAINAYAPATVQDEPLTLHQAEQIVFAWRRQYGDSLPWTDTSARGIALSYMCFRLNSAIRFRRSGLSEQLRKFPEVAVSDNPSCPVPTAVKGRIHGKCWQPNGLDYYTLTAHEIDLQSAALFLLGLNSSMRPEELLNLEVEMFQDDGTSKRVTERVQAPDGQVRHLLHGRMFKGQNGVDGTQRADGIARSWAITELGATAVNVLERLNGRHGRLFVTVGTANTSRSVNSLTTSQAALHMKKFVKRMRCLAAELELPGEYFFPEDAEDFMNLSVLRRTSEVLTQQEIGGVLAGAHQAGHRVQGPYDTRVTEGYGGLATQSKLGRRTSERTRQALAKLVADTRKGLIGGPAGERAVEVADLAAAELELVDPSNLMTPVLSKEWKRITKSVGQSVYEVPLAGGAHAYCIFYLPWSACTKEGEEPDIAGCKIACPNKALTTDSIRGLQQRQKELEASKQGAASEEVIRADHLIDAYEEQIADSGLPAAAPKKKGRKTR